MQSAQTQPSRKASQNPSSMQFAGSLQKASASQSAQMQSSSVVHCMSTRQVATMHLAWLKQSPHVQASIMPHILSGTPLSQVPALSVQSVDAMQSAHAQPSK